MNSKLVTLRALSPLHCGTGQGVGGIDLPIARERPTRLPIVPGSSVKGVLRAETASDADKHEAAFGPNTDNASEFAGAVQFSDLNLVFLPMRSLRGTFVYVTGPYTLRRLLRDAREAGVKLSAADTFAESPAAGPNALVTSEAATIAKQQVVIEDLDFKAAISDTLGSLAKAIAPWFFADEADQAHFAARVCLVHDDAMSVLSQIGTEVFQRNRLDPGTRTVQQGALWSEEALPVESLLAGLVVATPVHRGQDRTAHSRKELLDYVAGLMARPVQIGGKASVGRGLSQLRVAGS